MVHKPPIIEQHRVTEVYVTWYQTPTGMNKLQVHHRTQTFCNVYKKKFPDCHITG